MRDRTHTPPTPLQIADALAVLAQLARDGGLWFTAAGAFVLLHAAERPARRALLAALMYPEHYTRPDGQGGHLALWRGRLAGWQVSIAQPMPATPPDRTPAGPAPSGPDAGWPLTGQPTRHPTSTHAWQVGQPPVALPLVEPGPLTDPALSDRDPR